MSDQINFGRDLLFRGDTYLLHKIPISVIQIDNGTYPCPLVIKAVHHIATKHPREDLGWDLLSA